MNLCDMNCDDVLKDASNRETTAINKGGN